MWLEEKWKSTFFNDFRDRIRTSVNILGDGIGAGVVDHLVRQELDPIDLEEGENPEEAFDIRTNLSVLEAQVLQYIDGKEVNPKALKVLLENYIYWPRLERFYYIPVLLILIMSVMKAI